MQPEFEQYHEGIGAELVCPGCGSNYLHHGKVEIFDRSEDQSDGLHVVVGDQDVRIDKVMTGNPSTRRHGLKIHMDCEQCKCEPVLIIYQHKGQTYVDLRPTMPACD